MASEICGLLQQDVSSVSTVRPGLPEEKQRSSGNFAIWVEFVHMKMNFNWNRGNAIWNVNSEMAFPTPRSNADLKQSVVQHVDRSFVDLAWLLLRTNSCNLSTLDLGGGASFGARILTWIRKLSHLAQN